MGKEREGQRDEGAGGREPEGNPPLNAMKSHSSLIPGKPRGPVAFRNRDVTESPTSISFSLGLGF